MNGRLAGAEVAPYRFPRGSVDRVGYILGQCAGKRVLHLGCVDYASVGDWEHRFRDGTWLHERICRVAAEVVGVDNASDAVRLVRERYGWSNVFEGDAQRLERLSLGQFDVVIAGEIIEHLPLPGRLWWSARSVLRPGGSLVVTTTNAYCARRFIKALFGREGVHPDHLAYYSHRTLWRMADLHGYEVVEQLSYRLPNRRPLLPYLVERVACAPFPFLGEGIICRARPRPPAES